MALETVSTGKRKGPAKGSGIVPSSATMRGQFRSGTVAKKHQENTPIQVESTELGPCHHRLAVVIPVQRVRQEFDHAIKHEENQFDVNDCLGKSRFDWDDVDDQGYSEMLKIVEEAQEKMNKIAEKHALPVKKGGKRIAYMNFMSCIQK
ncbi:MAG: hypothetical protein H8E31_15785, partial [Planctomycetes bacterium]|nr:hypothetical protein [Planctomycetota bacterium]